MSLALDVFVLDAFCNGPFTGNPAAVVPLDEWLPDATLQAIAAEHNLSETAFVVQREGEDAYDLRWFTPTVEVALCGHATLAAGALILDDFALGASEVEFHSQSGRLVVSRLGDGYMLDFPAYPASETSAPPDLLEGLGARPEAVLRARNWLVVYSDEATIRGLTPDMSRLARLDTDVIVTAPGTDADFVSRFFAPQFGIPEDPVTGSAHCTLTPYWAARLGKERMQARQLSQRGGWLEVALRGERVEISGRVRRYLDGRIYP